MIRSVAILASAAALAGCSSTKTGTTSPPPAVTKAQFLVRADAICSAAKGELARLRVRVKSITLKSPTQAPLHELDALLRRNAAIARAAFEKLAALARKEGLAHGYGTKVCDRSE